MPSATAALGVDRAERNYLGGWSAQGSDRHARVAKRRISNMQKLVIKALQPRGQDTLAEEETLEALEEFITGTEITCDTKVHLLGLLRYPSLPAPADRNRTPEALEPQVPDDYAIIEPVPFPDPQDQEPTAGEKTDKRRKKKLLGLNPRQARENIRCSLAPGFYTCVSGKRRIRTLLRLGDCYNIPGVDYNDYVFQGAHMPVKSAFDTVCRLCAKKGFMAGGSFDSATSSSTSEGQ